VTIETLKDFSPGNPGKVERWIEEIRLADEFLDPWRKRARAVVERYTDQAANGASSAVFNVLWANTEILRAAIYGQNPRPDVRRRGENPDPTGRQAARIIERGLSFMWDTDGISGPAETQVNALLTDYLLTGRGVMRVRYVPRFVRRLEPVLEQQDADGVVYFGTDLEEVDPETIEEDDDGRPVRAVEELQFERADIEHTYYDDFLHAPARCWRDVRWIAFRHRFTSDELKAAFGPAKAARCSLTEATKLTAGGKHIGELFKKALVWEIWDRSERKVLFVSPGYTDGPLGEFDDEYGLRGFFPTPEPLRSIWRTDSLEPIPEYCIYQDQAQELEALSSRIADISEQIRIVGMYDASLEGLDALLAPSSTNKMLAVSNWTAVQERGGVNGAMSFLPIEPQIAALQVLYQQRQVVLDTIYQVVGLSDIIRGASDARETAAAQQLKSRYGGLRLQPRQRALQSYLRDVMRLQAELIAEKFAPMTLQLLGGVPIDDRTLLMLRADALRRFAVDIETDSTIAADDQADKAQVVEFFAAMSQFVTSVAPLVQAGQVSGEAAKALVLYGVRKFKCGRDVEEALEQPGQPQQEQPDPAEQAKAQATIADAETRRLSVMTTAQTAAEKNDLERRKLELEERELEADAMLQALGFARDSRQAQPQPEAQQ
jgi:hypothetical protein